MIANETHLMLETAGVAYALCGTTEESKSESFLSVLRTKYFDNLGNFMRHSLRELTRKVDRIAASIYTIETEDIHEMRLSIEKICSMQTTLLRDCIGSRAESENSWRFYEIRDIAVELDDEYRKIQSKVIDRCNTKTDREWLLKVFLEHTSMIADITKVLSIFRGRKDRLNLLVKSSITDGDMTKCLIEITGTQLSN